ncbi:TPA: hypothetical protein ACH3X2_003993 [Trebouxia sp. C0005]
MSDAGAVVMVLYEQLAPVAIKANQPGGCGVRNWVLHPLMSQPPKVFTLQLAWQTDNESKLDIKAALVGLREGLDLADVYLGIAMVAFNTMYAVWSVIMVNTT